MDHVNARPSRVVPLLALALLVAAVPGGLAAHAPDAQPAQPHRTTAHPAFGFPTSNDPTCAATPDAWTPPPAAPIPDPVGGLDPVPAPSPGIQAAGLTVFGGLAVVSAQAGDNRVYDVSDPDDVRALAAFGRAPTRDVQTIAFPDCRLFAVFAVEASPDRLEVWNLTDPRDPTLAAEILPPAGTHNLAVVPGTPIVYNANAVGGGIDRSAGEPLGQTEIYDLSDPSNPERVRVWENGYGCHDVTFHVDPASQRFRGYCAGVQVVQIWDATSPADPSIVHTMPFRHAVDPLPGTGVHRATIAHMATASQDGETLVVGDETLGGQAPACDAHAGAFGRSASGPAGNLWFYDVSNESDPTLRGGYSPHRTQPGDAGEPVDAALGRLDTCTSHFGRVFGGRDWIAAGFYGAGVHVVDFSDPANPRPVASWDEGTDEIWDVAVDRGRLYAGNQGDGMDVLELVPAS